MRNVKLWELTKNGDQSLPNYLRVLVFKGNKRVLNEFLAPSYRVGEGHLVPRDGTQGNHVPYDFLKGTVVVMGYDNVTKAEKGIGAAFVTIASYDDAIVWLVQNGYFYVSEESHTSRRRKMKYEDRAAINREYADHTKAVLAARREAAAIEFKPTEPTPQPRVHETAQHILKEIEAKHPESIMTESEFREKGIDLSAVDLPDLNAENLVKPQAVEKKPSLLSRIFGFFK